MPGRIYFEAEIPSSDGRTSDVKHWDAALETESFDDAVIMIYNAIREALAPETPIIRLWIDESMYAAIDLYAPENGSLHPGIRIASLRMRLDPWKKTSEKKKKKEAEYDRKNQHHAHRRGT